MLGRFSADGGQLRVRFSDEFDTRSASSGGGMNRRSGGSYAGDDGDGGYDDGGYGDDGAEEGSSRFNPPTSSSLRSGSRAPGFHNQPADRKGGQRGGGGAAGFDDLDEGFDVDELDHGFNNLNRSEPEGDGFDDLDREFNGLDHGGQDPPGFNELDGGEFNDLDRRASGEDALVGFDELDHDEDTPGYNELDGGGFGQLRRENGAQRQGAPGFDELDQGGQDEEGFNDLDGDFNELDHGDVQEDGGGSRRHHARQTSVDWRTSPVEELSVAAGLAVTGMESGNGGLTTPRPGRRGFDTVSDGAESLASADVGGEASVNKKTWRHWCECVEPVVWNDAGMTQENKTTLLLY